MLRKGMTRREAAQVWVKGFNAFPTGMIEKLRRADPDDWYEVTRPTVGDRVYVYDIGTGEIIRASYKSRRLKIKLDIGDMIWVEEGEAEIDFYTGLPMWGTMWAFGDSCDEHWLSDDDGIVLMSKCGFRIFESEEFGYFFGIDGAGYDFYEQHWLPLYKERGLKWHDPETDKKAV
ncbi:MAG: hypothetical protein IJR68_12930 [Fretibacterium sp.]|nr:hypothetical protein [Fretibacterium sp.]MBR0179052.1 hypothetical protein [Bacillota bacterium]